MLQSDTGYADRPKVSDFDQALHEAFEVLQRRISEAREGKQHVQQQVLDLQRVLSQGGVTLEKLSHQLTAVADGLGADTADLPTRVNN